MKRSDFLSIIPALFVAIKVKPEDADFRPVVPASVEEIAAYYKVPPAKISELYRYMFEKGMITPNEMREDQNKLLVQEWKDGKWVTKWQL